MAEPTPAELIDAVLEAVAAWMNPGDVPNHPLDNKLTGVAAKWIAAGSPKAGDIQTDLEHAASLLILSSESRQAIKALEEIKGKQGRVCIDFALCTHPACASSHASWAIADVALAARQTRSGG